MNSEKKDAREEEERRLGASAREAVDRALLPFMPLIYVAWSDGALSAREIRTLRDRLGGEDWLDDHARAVLERWLDPEHPPGAAAIQGLLGTIRTLAAALPEPQRLSLAALGLELAEAAAEPGDDPAPFEPAVLAELEDALGVVGAEALRGILPVTPPSLVPGPVLSFDTTDLQAVLFPHRAIREKVFSILARPAFRRDVTWDIATYRERVWEWCQKLAKEGLGGVAFPREFGGEGDIAKSISIFETIAHYDLSLTVKYGVQVGLFGGSVYQLGTRKHHERLLRAIGRAELAGCFAMTETRHGSNVRDLQTIARFDGKRDEFVIHTPAPGARKDYIGGAVLHARMATVFAQLETHKERHGVHAFLVPLRDETGATLPGVRIEDCGPKKGLNGVDNGRIYFDQVRIPRENLLDRFGSVDSNGDYTSSIPSSSRRFFTMLGTLVGGRISISAAALSAARVGLTIAVRYSAERRQFGPEGSPEVPLLTYPLQQRALIPRLAATYALHFAVAHTVRRYAAGPDEHESREIEVLAAGLKAYSSMHTVQTLQACREACGGQGYLSENRFADLMADTDVFTTFEGANPVLLQLVAKGLLTNFREQFGEIRLWGVVKLLANRAANAVTERNPIVTRLTGDDHLLSADFQLGAFRSREAQLLESLGRRLQSRIEAGVDSFYALNECQDHAATLALAHVERVVLERCSAGVTACRDPRTAAVLDRLRQLYALWRLEDDRGWFLESGYIEAGKSKAIRRLVSSLCQSLSTEAVGLVDAFGVPDTILGAPIAGGRQGRPVNKTESVADRAHPAAT
jgi:acyl-CoA oxidase